MWSRTITSFGRLFGMGKGVAEDERRSWGRVACDVETTIHPAAGGPGGAAPARVRNVSLGGVKMTSGQRYDPGALLSVALPLGDETEVLACVVRCDPSGDGLWELGCTFAAQLSDEDLLALGAKRERAAPPDQRDYVRFPCHATAGYRVVRAGEERNGAAAVLDVSASGIALHPDSGLQVGDLLELELRRDGAMVLTTLASVVRTANAPDGSRVIGCNFIRELANDQVVALL